MTSPLTEQQLDQIRARQRVADQILPIVFGTTVSRAACFDESADSIARLTAQRIADNLEAWIACGDWTDRPLTEAEIDDAECDSVSALAAEIAGLRAQLEAARAATSSPLAAPTP